MEWTVLEGLVLEGLVFEEERIAAEAMGWQPIEPGCYLHVVNPDERECVVNVIGVPDLAWVGSNVLLLV